MSREPEKSSRKQAGRFAPGQSGNPAGKPRGTRNKVLAALDQIGAAGAEDALRAVVKAAGSGDLRAAEILLARVWPICKGAPVTLPLPPLRTAADLVLALGAVAGAVGEGAISPEEGAAVAGVLEGVRRAIETTELEQRLAAIEERLGDANN